MTAASLQNFETPLREQLAKIIPLLGSTEDGEALGAARALQRVLVADGKDLNDLGRAVGIGIGATAAFVEIEQLLHNVHRRLLVEIQLGGWAMSDTERKFVKAYEATFNRGGAIAAADFQKLDEVAQGVRKRTGRR
jgi:hypothetical protein